MTDLKLFLYSITDAGPASSIPYTGNSDSVDLGWDLEPVFKK